MNRTDIRSFCGLVQQLQSFSPRLTELLAPIRALFSPKSEFFWEAPYQEAFQQVIRELASPRVLANFRPSRTLRLETDAAQAKSLGMALWQQQPSGDWRLLQCGSRHVTAAKSRTLQQRWNSWPLCGPPQKPTSTSQGPTLNSLSTTGHSSHFSTRRYSTRCRQHD